MSEVDPQAAKGPVLPERAAALRARLPSNVREDLRRLAELGMLDIERPDDSRRAYYVRTNIELGQLIEAAAGILDIETREG